MTISTMLHKLLRKTAIAVLWLGIWAVAAAMVGQPILLPSPIATLQALGTLATKGTFWASVGVSMLRILGGFSLGILVGVPMAALTARFPWWRDFFAPLLAVVKATPVASFIILALVWIKVNGVPVFATFLVVLPIAWANTATGILSTDPNLLEMARAFQLSPTQTLRHIYWPTVRPFFRAAVMTGMGMAWKAGVAAEIIATPKLSLGRHLYDAKIYLNTPSLFATTAVVILLSILLERLVVRLARRGERRPSDGQPT